MFLLEGKKELLLPFKPNDSFPNYLLSLFRTSGPDSLCAHKPDGALFGLSKLRPNMFVHCDHGKANCKTCPDHQFFSDKFSVCVRRTVRPKCHGNGCKPSTPKPHPHKKCKFKSI